MCDDTNDDCQCEYETIMSSTSCQSCTTWAMGQPKLLEPRGDVTVEQAEASIVEMYESGIPFFTKQAIQGLWDRIQSKTTLGDKIVTKDMTGNSLEWNVKLGKSIELTTTADRDVRHEYISAAHLKGNLRCGEVGKAAYAPLQLMHQLFRVDSSSENKETIPDDPIGERDDVARDFQKLGKYETCKNLKSILRSFASGHPADKIIGFACGSLALPNNHHVSVQTALLVTVKNWLKERVDNSDVSSYIQDPMNTSVDKEVLADFDFEMIDDPRGWLEVDERSFVLSVAPNVPVKEIIVDTARPAIAFTSDNDDFQKVVVYIRKSETPPTPNPDGTFFTPKGDK
ncbi:hypothetical protein N7478_007882 [Penicillium angulare]|uniref:uncharacterized protein n=1 Tax=Penicillium angulare TaxID=116970 RepID=UPI002540C626|nr:uncharacterized protein N7478_007882 [Penicillium angulare]KAJ5272757.1 hypothetical protein N7478_007882 [Penicillium angulare]